MGTPPVVSRTASPFLSAGNANGSAARPKSPSPLAGAANDAENALPAPTAIRTTSSSAIRKGPSASAGAKRANVLGAKKTQKLGAKKVAGDEIDFEAAEKAAKAEAERIEKLGYDPEAEKAEELAKKHQPVSPRPKQAPAPIQVMPAVRARSKGLVWAWEDWDLDRLVRTRQLQLPPPLPPHRRLGN